MEAIGQLLWAWYVGYKGTYAMLTRNELVFDKTLDFF